MIITIDGPTASGKSTVAQTLAARLSFYYLNTGFLYRGLAYALQSEGIDFATVGHMSLEDILGFIGPDKFKYTYDEKARVFYNNTEITGFLKTAQFDNLSSSISKFGQIRKSILNMQRYIGANNKVVAEGRDCGTVVFPDASHKFFLTAELNVRALRWQRDQANKGKIFSVEESIAALISRDARDKDREHSPCIAAENATLIDNSDLTVDETLQLILNKLG